MSSDSRPSSAWPCLNTILFGVLVAVSCYVQLAGMESQQVTAAQVPSAEPPPLIDNDGPRFGSDAPFDGSPDNYIDKNFFWFGPSIRKNVNPTPWFIDVHYVLTGGPINGRVVVRRISIPAKMPIDKLRDFASRRIDYAETPTSERAVYVQGGMVSGFFNGRNDAVKIFMVPLDTSKPPEPRPRPHDAESPVPPPEQPDGPA